jgi:MFS transporter, YNFM family, putative membrane transport protein
LSAFMKQKKAPTSKCAPQRASGKPGPQSRTGILFALFVTGFSAFITLYATQPMLPRFREIFHTSEVAVSLTVTAPVLAIALLAPIEGLIADTLGRKRVIVATLLGAAVPTLLAGLSRDLGQLIFWRFCQGIFIPGIIAVTMAYISEETPRHLAGSTMAIYVTGTVVGGFAGRFITGVIVSRWEWPLAFEVIGTLALLGGLLTWWLLPASQKFVRQNSVAASLKSMGNHLHNPRLLATYAVGFNCLFSLVGAFTYINFHLADAPFHLGPTALASVFGVYLIGAVITPMAGRVLDRIGHRRALLRAATAMGVGGLLTLVPSIPVIVLGLAIVASSAFTSQASASSFVGRAAKKARSSASGLYVAFYYLGGCTGSILPGFLWKWTGWAGCVGLLIAVQTVTAWIAHKYWREEAPAPEASSPLPGAIPEAPGM